MATITDVVRKAKVSVVTISRVLIKQDSVRPETSERVCRAIEKLSFDPNMSARNLMRKETRVILIVTPNISNSYYSHILTGIGDAANEFRYTALIYNTSGDETHQKEGMEMLKRRRADGAIQLANNIGSIWIQEYACKYPIVQCLEYALPLEPSQLPRNWACGLRRIFLALGLMMLMIPPSFIRTLQPLPSLVMN